LPSDVLASLRYEATSWFGKHYSTLDRIDRKIAHSGFDHIVEALEGAGVEMFTSGIGQTSVGGVEIPSNRMGVKYAINAPTGHLAQGLIDAFFDRKPRRNKPMAKDLCVRLERLLSLPGEGGWHALTIVAQQIHTLFSIDPKWSKKVILPRFNPEHGSAEAAWSGFLVTSRLARPPLFRSLKAYFLDAIAATPRWTAEELPHLGQHLLLAIELSSPRRVLLSVQEGRAALRASSAALRQETLWFLRGRAAAKGAWDRLVVPFFNSVWPREREFQTASTTRTLVQFLTDLNDRFPDGVSLVSDYLVQAPDTDLVVYQFGSEREHGHADLTTRYPLDTLFLLSRIIDETSERAPYGLADVLSRLATAAPEVRHDERWQRLHRLTLT
jgi:hypothetical protein